MKTFQHPEGRKEQSLQDQCYSWGFSQKTLKTGYCLCVGIYTYFLSDGILKNCTWGTTGELTNSRSPSLKAACNTTDKRFHSSLRVRKHCESHSCHQHRAELRDFLVVEGTPSTPALLLLELFLKELSNVFMLQLKQIRPTATTPPKLRNLGGRRTARPGRRKKCFKKVTKVSDRHRAVIFG